MVGLDPTIHAVPRAPALPMKAAVLTEANTCELALVGYD